MLFTSRAQGVSTFPLTFRIAKLFLSNPERAQWIQSQRQGSPSMPLAESFHLPELLSIRCSRIGEMPETHEPPLKINDNKLQASARKSAGSSSIRIAPLLLLHGSEIFQPELIFLICFQTLRICVMIATSGGMVP